MGVIEPYISEQVVTEGEKKLPTCLAQFFALFRMLPSDWLMLRKPL